MDTIYKYPLNSRPTASHSIDMPVGARILSCQVQHGVICLWALVDTEAEGVERRVFDIFPTGRSVDSSTQFIATVQLMGGDLVYHVFEKRV